MNRLARCAPNGTNRKTFGSFLGGAIVTCRLSLLNDLNLTIESGRATLDQGNIGSQTHLVDMTSCFQVIQSVEDHRKTLKPLHVEPRILNIGMISFQIHRRVELVRRILCYLNSFVNALVCPRFVQPTKAFDFLMCSCLKRNCLLRLLKSIVSRSTIWISPKPVRTRFFNSSQPIPPAPTINIRACSMLLVLDRCAQNEE